MRLMLVILGGALAASAQENHSQHHNAVAGLGTVNLSTSCNTAGAAFDLPAASEVAFAMKRLGYTGWMLIFEVIVCAPAVIVTVAAPAARPGGMRTSAPESRGRPNP